MAAIKQPRVRKFLTLEEVTAIFSSRNSVDPCSEYTSTTDESNLTDIWESSDDESDDFTESSDESCHESSTDYSGSSPAIESSSSNESEADGQYLGNGWATVEGRQLRPQKHPVMLTAAGQPPQKKFCGAEIGCEETKAHDEGHDQQQSGGGGGRERGQGNSSRRGGRERGQRDGGGGRRRGQRAA